MRSTIVVSALVFAAASSAQAAVTGVTWRQVDNSVGYPMGDSFVGANWNSVSRVTFDLILLGDAGQRINGINMGDAAFPNAAPFALYTNGAVFNHPFGSNVRSTAFENLPNFNALRYDTFVALDGSSAPIISFAGVADVDANGTTDQAMRATWFTTDSVTLDANGEMRIMRVTVGYDILQLPPDFDAFLGTNNVLGGELFTGQRGELDSIIEVGLPGGELVQFLVGDAFYPPAPGTTILLSLAAATGLRRRR